MQEKTVIYFYKNLVGQNKYLATATVTSAQGTDALLSSIEEHLYKKIPKLNLGKYALIDGVVFKLSSLCGNEITEDNLKNSQKKMSLKPSQKVLVTNDGVYIDGQKLDFVTDVKPEHLRENIVKINIEFLAASYEERS